MADPPVLKTPRLVLRGHRLADFEAMAAMWAETETVRHIGEGRPLDGDSVFSKLLRMAGMWSLLGFGFWAVEEAGSGRLIGEIGFLERRRADGRPPWPEAGWALASAARGKGYGTEALAAALVWGDQRFERTICIISPGNAPSLALARRHGYRQIDPIVVEGRALVAMERERPAPVG